ncbi:hypothetical protein Ddye_031013 [Dipteronia dyeriana]|uniref:Glutathione S-transferase n=1 Tax=Dipteronia dyeriana TaxID=168575 RepID=A0AAD9THQ5_9ROSI|nr:hypothetical protein Ddye_031013 [Dipteronia dyeriana]
MEKQKLSEAVLIGFWASSYCHRVELALKIKGIPYQFVEEDLSNKSDLLIQYNPVHKKVPVLVHKGKAIAESLVILEYIEDCWDNTPQLLPQDPYERAKIRFWANFYDQKVIPSSYPIVHSKGKAREKAMAAFKELLRVFDDGIEKDFPTRSPILNGETLGFLDVIVAAITCIYPAFLSRLNALNGCPAVKETLPPHDKLVVIIRKLFL